MIEDVQDLQAFGQNFCDVRMDGDTVTVSCDVTDQETGQLHHYERSINLAPIVDWLQSKFCDFHQRAHGCQPAPAQVSGLGSQFIRTARNLAASKGVRQLAVDAAPILFPGSVITWELANEASKTVVKAKQGDPAAKEKVVAVKQLADAGDPKAQEVVKTMAAASAIVDAKNANPASEKPTSLYKRGLHIGAEKPWMCIVGHDAVDLGAMGLRAGQRVKRGGSGRGAHVRDVRTTHERSDKGFGGIKSIKDHGVTRSQIQAANYRGQQALNAQNVEFSRQQALQQQMAAQQMAQQNAMMQAQFDAMGGMDSYNMAPGMDMGMDPYGGGAMSLMDQYGINPYDSMGGDYGGWDPTMPQNTGAQVYDPATESFSSSTVKSYYDPNTETFQNYTNQ